MHPLHLTEWARNVGDTSAMDLADQLSAARTAMGAADRNKNSWLRRNVQRHAGQMGITATANAVPVINNLIDFGVHATQSVAKKPIIWDELRKQIAKENYNE